jgi:hypothetical protein
MRRGKVMAVPDWVVPGISGLALAVSITSTIISALAYRRAGASERVRAWLGLQRTSRTDWMLATMHVINASRVQIKLHKFIIEVAPDFKMGDYESVVMDDGSGNRTLPKEFEVKELCIAMPCSSKGDIVVPTNGTVDVPFLIYQASFSRKSKVHVGIMYMTMEEKPSFKTIQTVARTRSEI